LWTLPTKPAEKSFIPAMALAPIAAVKPPSIFQDIDTSDELVLVSEAMSPQTAFEVFKGKMYSVAAAPRSAAAAAASLDKSPLEKLARLQQEVSILEQELQTTAADSGCAFDEQVVQLAMELKTRLATASAQQVAEQD
jgi:hypothetical protein